MSWKSITRDLRFIVNWMILSVDGDEPLSVPIPGYFCDYKRHRKPLLFYKVLYKEPHDLGISNAY